MKDVNFFAINSINWIKSKLLYYVYFRNSNKRAERISKIYSKQEDRVTEECNNIGKNKVAQKHTTSTWNELNLGMTVTPIFPAESGDRVAIQVPMFDETFINNERLLKPIGNLYPFNSELKEIADVMSRVRNKKYVIHTILFLSRNYVYFLSNKV